MMNTSYNVNKLSLKKLSKCILKISFKRLKKIAESEVNHSILLLAVNIL